MLVSWKTRPTSPPTRPVTLPPSGRSWRSAWVLSDVPHASALLNPDHCTRCGALPILPIRTKSRTVEHRPVGTDAEIELLRRIDSIDGDGERAELREAPQIVAARCIRPTQG